jgi:nitroreductase
MFIDLVRVRRSIRKFQARPVEKEKIELLVETALRAPSSRGFNPWEFVVVADPETLTRLSKAKPHGAAFLKDAPLGIVICADPTKSDVWVEDTSIVSIMLHLVATDLGLGSCWIQIRKRDYDRHQTASDYIARVLDLRPGLEVATIMAIGYSAQTLEPHPRASLQDEKVSYERYGRSV